MSSPAHIIPISESIVIPKSRRLPRKSFMHPREALKFQRQRTRKSILQNEPLATSKLRQFPPHIANLKLSTRTNIFRSFNRNLGVEAVQEEAQRRAQPRPTMIPRLGQIHSHYFSSNLTGANQESDDHLDMKFGKQGSSTQLNNQSTFSIGQESPLPSSKLNKGTKYGCCPCLKRRKKGVVNPFEDSQPLRLPSRTNRKSVFYGMNKYQKRQKVIELWQRGFRKVNLINRVMRQIKSLNKEIKMYGASNSVGLQRKREQALIAMKEAPATCIIFPESKSKLIWSLIMIVLLLFTAGYVPFRLAFLDEISLTLEIIEYIVDILFGIDIIHNFFSAYYDNDNVLVTDKGKITKEYLKSWFIPDLLACFPFQLMEGGDSSGGQYNKLIRLSRIPRLYRMIKILRLLKMLKMVRYSRFYEKISFYLQMNQGVIRLAKMFLAFLLLVHIFGCLWFFSAKSSDFNPDTWVVRGGIMDSSIGFQYLTSIYWVITTLTTVGYGDIVPYTILEKIFSLVVMILGVGFYSYTIGNLSSILANIDRRDQKLNAKLLSLNDFAQSMKMNEELYYRLKRILKKNHETNLVTMLDTESLLSELPPALKAEVVNFTNKKLFTTIPYFKGKDPNYLADIINCLRPITIMAGEFVYRDGDVADEIYFINRGRIKMATADYYLYRTYVTGSFFGEIEILTADQCCRDSYAIASEECELLVCRKMDFLNLMHKYPEIETEMTDLVKQRKEKNIEAVQIAIRGNFRMDTHERESCVETNTRRRGSTDSTIYRKTYTQRTNNSPKYLSPKSNYLFPPIVRSSRGSFFKTQSLRSRCRTESSASSSSSTSSPSSSFDTVSQSKSSDNSEEEKVQSPKSSMPSPPTFRQLMPKINLASHKGSLVSGLSMSKSEKFISSRRSEDYKESQLLPEQKEVKQKSQFEGGRRTLSGFKSEKKKHENLINLVKLESLANRNNRAEFTSNDLTFELEDPAKSISFISEF